jgi:uncharacterized delta-60 repeat protein
MKKTLLTISAFILGGWTLAQNPGDIDLTFGTSGYTLTDPYASTDEGYYDLITLANDKVVKIGYANDANNTDILVARFDADGSPDVTFGSNGFLRIDLSIGGAEEGRSVIELADGKLIITGTVQTANGYAGFVMRINEDGSMDDTFGDMMGHTQINAPNNTTANGKCVLEFGGELFVSGELNINGISQIYVCNLSADGIIDNSFATNGFGYINPSPQSMEFLTALETKSNGELIFGGYFNNGGPSAGFVAALSQFGTPTTFGTNGIYLVDYNAAPSGLFDLLVDDNNNIIAAGYTGTNPNADGLVMRLTPTGELDQSWASQGYMLSDPGQTTLLVFRSVAKTLDGGIILVGEMIGTNKNIYAMLLNSNGTLNPGFGGNGDVIIDLPIQVVEIQVAKARMQNSGKIVIGGVLTSQDFTGINMFLTRILPYASLGLNEISENDNIVVYPNPAEGAFNVSAEEIRTVQMLDLQGKLVSQWDQQISYTLPMGLNSGTYIIKVETGSGLLYTRLMIK